MECDCDYPEIVDTSISARGLSRRLNGRQKKRDNHTNDRGNNKHLGKRRPTVLAIEYAQPDHNHTRRSQMTPRPERRHRGCD